MTDLFKLSVPGKPEYVSTVRMTAAALASTAGFDVEAIDDIKVAVSEACTNVVRHGTKESNDYEVSFDLSEEQMAISIADEAGGYDVSGYRVPEPDCPKEGGLGIFIIRALMDEVEIVSKPGLGTKIRMVKYVQKQE